MQPARAVVGDDDGFREHAAGFPAPPFRIEQVDVHGKHHAGAEFVADGRERRGIAALRVVAAFKRSPSRVTVRTCVVLSRHFVPCDISGAFDRLAVKVVRPP